MWPFKKREKETRTVYKFIPLEDITAYELATVVTMLIGRRSFVNIDERPEEITRHFKEKTIEY